MNLLVYTTLSVATASIVLGAGFSKDGIELFEHIRQSKFNTLVMVNLAYNMLFLFGKLLQIIFFGKLRDIESKKIYDRLLQYILFKMVFVGAIVEPDFQDLLVWFAWFSILGFMKIFSFLTRDRFEYITTFNPTTRTSVHVKLILLLNLILLSDILWFYSCVTIFHEAGYSVLLLLTFECFALFLETIQTLIKYVIHLVDISRQGVWEQRGTYTYYTEFVTETLVLIATLGHYIQILIWHGVSFTLIDAVLFLLMRMVFNNLRERITSYRNYRQLAKDMKDRYPDVSPEELNSLNDICPICHDRLETAKRLPCGHIFHYSCLRSWLEHHHNCPTCRYSLIETSSGPAGPASSHQPNQNIHQNHHMWANREEIFRLNAPRWLSWLPSIHVVSERRTFNFPQGPAFPVPPEMIQRVQEILPHVPVSLIREDLIQTRSVEATIINFLDRRVPLPEEAIQRPPVQNSESREENPPPSEIHAEQPALSRSDFNNGTNLRDDSLDPPRLSDEFASSPEERQSRILQRKRALLEHARSQYTRKQKEEEEETRRESQQEPTSQNQEDDSPQKRRQLFLEAAVKRQTNNQS